MKTYLINWRRLLSVIKKEFRQIIRDPVSLRVPLLLPVFWIILFGYAVNFEVEQLPIAIVDESKTTSSESLIERLQMFDAVQVESYAENKDELLKMIDRGQVKAGIYIPAGYGAVKNEEDAPVISFYIDGSEAIPAQTALNLSTQINERLAGELLEAGAGNQQRLTEQSTIPQESPHVKLEPIVQYNPEMSKTVFTIPGLIGLVVQNMTIILSAFTIVRERERGTIEQLIVTPIKPQELIFGKLLPYAVIGYAGFLFCLFICYTLFQFHVTGNFVLLLCVTLIFVICSLSIGIVISSLAKTQLQALNYTSMVLLPSVLLSGFLFPRDSMPLAIELISYLIPLTYFVEIMRDISVKGANLSLVWENTAILIGFTLLLLLLANKRFKKSMD